MNLVTNQWVVFNADNKNEIEVIAKFDNYQEADKLASTNKSYSVGACSYARTTKSDILYINELTGEVWDEK